MLQQQLAEQISPCVALQPGSMLLQLLCCSMLPQRGPNSPHSASTGFERSQCDCPSTAGRTMVLLLLR